MCTPLVEGFHWMPAAEFYGVMTKQTFALVYWLVFLIIFSFVVIWLTQTQCKLWPDMQALTRWLWWWKTYRMFYFFFESRGNKTDDPVVLWMTGGPGCASELALFYENGPFKITDNLTLVWNDYGWDQVTTTTKFSLFETPNTSCRRYRKSDSFVWCDHTNRAVISTGVQHHLCGSTCGNGLQLQHWYSWHSPWREGSGWRHVRLLSGSKLPCFFLRQRILLFVT